jgi:hypothetical protein
MQKLMITLTTSALVLGSAVWVVKATPLTASTGISSQDYSPIEKSAVQEQETIALTAIA